MRITTQGIAVTLFIIIGLIALNLWSLSQLYNLQQDLKIKQHQIKDQSYTIETLMEDYTKDNR